jgi:hypothetical protein
VNARLILSAHALDALTLLIVASQFGIGGELNPLARSLWGAAGPAGVLALKAAGAFLLILVAGRSNLRLSLAVLAGLAGATVNALAWTVLR